MKQVVVILVCLLMSSEMLWAGDGNHYDFTPKSPEAAAFNRISDIPMNNYTGSMSFSIPIYTLVCGDIQVPISLDYQGNCIPVSQEATWVGLNWLLNAGGAITATLSTTSTNYGETFKKDWNYMLNSVSMERIPLDGEFPQILYKMDGEHPDWRGSHGKRWFKQTWEPENLRCNGDYQQDTISNSSFKELTKRHFTDLPIERVFSLKDENGTHVMDSHRENGNITKEFALNNQGDVNRGAFPLLKDIYSFDNFYTNVSLTYNSAGNPREVRDAEGVICSYIWGYCNTYPIAVVKGCDFATICELLGGETYIQSLENAEIPNLSPRGFYDKLKKKSYINVTTYGFTPHVGMIEMVSPNGESMTYTYDGFCRLSSVIDQDGIVANSYKYYLKR